MRAGLSTCTTCTKLITRSCRALSSGFEGHVGHELAHALRRMGCFAPNEVQDRALAIAGSSGKTLVLVTAQTGSGKTLVSLLPMLHRLQRSAEAGSGGGRSVRDALLVAPTRDLVRQHAAVATELAKDKTVPVECIFDEGGAAAVAVASAADRLPRLLVATPTGALALARSHRQQPGKPRLGAAGWSAVAIDEVDAVLCGGALEEVVAPAGEKLLRELALGGKAQAQCGQEEEEDPELELLVLTTAYLTPAHDTALSRRFPGVQRVRQMLASGGRGGTLVPTLRQRFHYFSGDAGNKEQKLLNVLENDASVISNNAGKRRTTATGTMVFCASGKQAVHLQRLVAETLPALRPAVLHSAMADEARAAVLRSFHAAEAHVLLCTDVAARGLDFPGLAHVVLYDLPVDVLSYVHCAGRTARRGSNGVVTCLVQSRAEAQRFRKLHALQSAAKLEFAAGPVKSGTATAAQKDGVA